MKLAVVIYSGDAETVWNAFRMASAALAYDDEVVVFLLGKGVECVEINSLRYNVKEQMEIYKEHGGNIIGCGVCCETRQDEMPMLAKNLDCELGSMQDLYALVKDSDKVLTF